MSLVGTGGERKGNDRTEGKGSDGTEGGGKGGDSREWGVLKMKNFFYL